jgi:catechol 2,3-dioxygenase-like lactoylglutathione lyase family enzyme
MITGVHSIIYSANVESLRGFFRDVLGFDSVDSGGGWLIFALPPGELAAHPTDGDPKHELYLMCDDLDATVAQLRTKGVETGSVSDEGWGRLTYIKLPGGGEMGLYQPSHASPIRR